MHSSYRWFLCLTVAITASLNTLSVAQSTDAERHVVVSASTGLQHTLLTIPKSRCQLFVDSRAGAVSLRAG